MPDELTRALLVEEVASERSIADALYASVTGGVPLVQALVDARAVHPELLARYLERSNAPFLRHVVPLAEVLERLPTGLCARLLALPVRRDAITGTVDVVVADPRDPHPAREIEFHLRAPVRLVRAPLAAIEEALRKIRSLSQLPPEIERELAVEFPREDDPMYDSRPRARPALDKLGNLASATRRMATLPPPQGALPSLPISNRPRAEMHRPSHRPSTTTATDAVLAALESATAALRPSRMPDLAAAPPPPVAPPNTAGAPLRAGPRETPPWGTPVHNPGPPSGSEPPRSNLGSEIPIPLTRRTFSAVNARGGTQRPPPMHRPAGLDEGMPVPFDPRQLHVVELRRLDLQPRPSAPPAREQPPSFIPGPPPQAGVGSFNAYQPILPLADIGGIMSAIRAAGSRDEVLELVLTASRSLAYRVALFVVKRGGYMGWACTPEFGDRAALQRVLVPLDSNSVFDEAVRIGLYLGPIRHDEVHVRLLTVMKTATKDVALVPVRVSGKTAAIIVADDLGDTMISTRRLEEVARAAGESFARILRMRR